MSEFLDSLTSFYAVCTIKNTMLLFHIILYKINIINCKWKKYYTLFVNKKSRGYPLVGGLGRILHYTALNHYTEHRDAGLTGCPTEVCGGSQLNTGRRYYGRSPGRASQLWTTEYDTSKTSSGTTRTGGRSERRISTHSLWPLTPLCRTGMGTQRHILCECPASAQVRRSNQITTGIGTDPGSGTGPSATPLCFLLLL